MLELKWTWRTTFLFPVGIQVHLKGYGWAERMDVWVGAEWKPMPTPHPVPFTLLQPHLSFCLGEDDAHYVFGEKRIVCLFF